ncbi:cytochrome P450 3A27-like [Salvelinus alpinus]
MSFLPYFSAETWTLLALLITLIVVYGYWPYGVFTKMGIPGPKPLPYFGTMMEYRKGFTNFDTECFQKYGRIWGIYDGRQPVLCIMDQSLIKTVLIKECYNIFTNRRNFMFLNGELFDALSVAEDDTWRRIRSVLSPSFTSGRLKEMFGIMKHHSANLLNGMKKQADKDQTIEVKEFFGPYSMDVVTSTAFSVDIDSLNNPSDPFVSNVKKMIKFDMFNPLLLLFVLFPFTGPILEKMKFSFFPSAVTDFFYASLAKIKSGRDTGNSTSRVDFLQLMIDSQKGNDTKTGEEQTKGLTDHEILSQAMIFIFAGYETSSTTMSFLAYNLATNPHVMTKLQEEIDAVFPNKAPIQYEALLQMDYLDCVLNESLRLYPVMLRLERVAKKTVEINGIVIPKDCVVLVPTWTLHRDPEIWSDPQEFKPERFSKENKESIDPYTYMPFGAGPRNCIGMRFALIMIKLAMVEILQSFTFSVCDETEIPLEMDIQGMLMPKRPIKLRLEPRSNIPSNTTTTSLKSGITNFDTECFQKYGRIWGIYDGRQPVLCIMDKSMIKTVLIKECYNIFTNRRKIILSGEMFDAVSLAEDDTWRRIRSVLSPSFTSGRLKEMFGIMKQHSANLLNGMKKQADKDQAIEVKEFFGPYSMDVVTSTAFSVDMDSLNNPSDPFVSNVKKMIKFDLFNPLFLLILLFPFTGPILEKMKFSFFPTAVLDFFYASLAKIKSGRDTGNSTNRVDFLQLMIDSQKGNDTKTGEEQTKGLTDHEILSQAMIFIFGGYETSSTTMSFLAYNLATNPHTLTKLQEEIDTVFPNKAPIQYEALLQMDYLDCVLNESLRLYPIVPRLDRVAKKTVEINGIVIPKDCVVLVPTWTLHRDPEIWSDPEEFKPERFSKENKESIDPYTYMPFGAGPRNCIGMRFALIMIKLAMVEILQSFTFSVCDETEIPLEMDIQGMMMPKQPIKLRLEPRSNIPSNTTTTSLKS